MKVRNTLTILLCLACVVLSLIYYSKGDMVYGTAFVFIGLLGCRLGIKMEKE